VLAVIAAVRWGTRSVASRLSGITQTMAALSKGAIRPLPSRALATCRIGQMASAVRYLREDAGRERLRVEQEQMKANAGE